MVSSLIVGALLALGTSAQKAGPIPISSIGLPALQCSHMSLVDPKGKTVLLRGINLGGWFVEEMWMTPFEQQNDPGGALPQVLDHVSLWNAVEKNLGHDAMVRVREAYRSNWITDDDFARIKAAGFNSVRLPFLSSLIDEPGGVQWLHKAVNMARVHQLYVVLDMHGAPGGQSTADHTGQVNQNQLWYGWDNITKMASIWGKLALEFGNDPGVAMFDLMNEPMGALNNSMLYLTYDRSYESVRAVSPKKVMMVEDGYKGLAESPNPNVPGWTDIAYSVHQYNFGATQPQDHIDALKANLDWWQQLIIWRDSPMYIGEFNCEPYGTPDTTKAMIKLMEGEGWSWATWTYKTMAPGGPMGQWGLYRYAGSIDPVHPYTDDEATMIQKIKLSQTKNMESAPGLLEMFKSL